MGNSSNKVSIFLVIVAICAIIIAIFAWNRPSSLDPSLENAEKEYLENIQMLNDTIQELRKDIAVYESTIDSIQLEREKIRKELEFIIKNNEKIDIELSNGDWDYNIKFLSNYLSEEDNLRE